MDTFLNNLKMNILYQNHLNESLNFCSFNCSNTLFDISLCIRAPSVTSIANKWAGTLYLCKARVIISINVIERKCLAEILTAIGTTSYPFI